MRKIIFFLGFLFSCSEIVYTLQPVIQFTDLTSGPNIGGRNGKGVFVYIRGSNFGPSRGSSYVTVGGGRADNYIVWRDNEIWLQLGRAAETGDVVVHTSDGESNGIFFAVRSGNIYFVDGSAGAVGNGSYSSPWDSPADFYRNMRPGDICYIREGTYTGSYGEKTSYNLHIRYVEHDPTSERPIAWVGYPEENVIFAGKPTSIAVEDEDYFIFSNLRLHPEKAAFMVYETHEPPCTDNRLINCEIKGDEDGFNYGMIGPYIGHDTKIWGCEIWNGHGSKLEHPVYIGYGADNIDVGWCHFHDNSVNVGPIISVNQDDAYAKNLVFEKIRIHDNILDGSGENTRAIGFIATAPGSSIYFYNNIVINCGGYYSYSPCIYQMSGSGYWYNNTFYNCGGDYAAYIYTLEEPDKGNFYYPEYVGIKNNIFYAKPGTEYIKVDRKQNIGKIEIANNCYYGNGKGPSIDINAVNADPRFRGGSSAYDLRLKPSSPCIDAGYGTALISPRDFNGNIRPQGRIDIGACEFVQGSE